jgi:hypothetical protein
MIEKNCMNIILDYKKSFDSVIKQNNNIIDIINEKYNDKTILKMNILYKDFKELYLQNNINNRKIKFSINCYGNGHYLNNQLFDLDFINDKILHNYIVIYINKNINTRTIIIKLYHLDYDYNHCDEINNLDNGNIDYDSDLDDIEDFLV